MPQKQKPLTTKVVSEWRALTLSKRTVILISALLAIGALPAFIKYAVITSPLLEMNSLVQDLVDSEPTFPSEWKYLDWQYIGLIDKPSPRPEGGMQKPIYAITTYEDHYLVVAYMASEQDIIQRNMISKDYTANSIRCSPTVTIVKNLADVLYVLDGETVLPTFGINCPYDEADPIKSFDGSTLSKNRDWEAERTFLKKAREWAITNNPS